MNLTNYVEEPEMTDIGTEKKYTSLQNSFLFLLRIAIGWHLLYEGIVKLLMPNWTSAEYLALSRWIFAPVFNWIASTPSVLSVVDMINIWALILIGLALMLGLYTRIAAFAGAVLLSLYYVSNPPFVGFDYGVPTEGNYLIVNKTLIEIFALVVLGIFHSGMIWGLDMLLTTKSKKSPEVAIVNASEPEHESQAEVNLDRRLWLKSLAAIPFMGAFAISFARKKQWQSYEEQNLVDAVTSASTKTIDLASLSELKSQIPKAKIKEVEFSRLILGGNLLSGWAHSRDLMYVSQLVKAYHNKDKIFGTLLLAEKCGINTLLTNPILCTIIDEYWKRNIGKIQFISDCAGLDYDAQGKPSASSVNEYMDRIKRAIDYGAVACYIQGETADFYMSQGNPEIIARAIQLIRDNNVIVGIGAHRIETIKASVEAGFKVDFWMKTLHHHNYWSARHHEWHDNKYCFNPEETISYMKELKEPVIAFKTMAAGAIHPKEAFRYAFEKGADFICAGMYDFQMVDDVNITLDILNDRKLAQMRERQWMA